MLSDHDIKKLLKKRANGLRITPGLEPRQIGPASIDLRLGDTFLVFKRGHHLELNPRTGIPGDFMERIVLNRERPFVLHSNNFVLASTVEHVTVPNDHVLRVEGKSTLARMGILVHTAGFIDPGFFGNITLEISNHADLPVLLYPGMFICQIAVHKLSSKADVPYHKRKRSLYHGGKGPAAASTKNLF